MTTTFVAKLTSCGKVVGSRLKASTNSKYPGLIQFPAMAKRIVETERNQFRATRLAYRLGVVRRRTKRSRLSFTGTIIPERSRRGSARGDTSFIGSFIFERGTRFSRASVARNLYSFDLSPAADVDVACVCNIAFIRRAERPDALSLSPPRFLNYHGRADDDTVVAIAP